jgi:hypothetical protein
LKFAYNPVVRQKGNAMTTVSYSRIKLGIAVPAALGMGWLGLWVWSNFSGSGAWAAGFMAAAMVFVAGYFARYLADNRVMTIGATSLEFHGFLGTRRLRLDQIADIAIEVTKQNHITQRHLVIQPVSGAGRKMRIAEMMLEKRFGGVERVAEMIANGSRQPSPEPFPLPRRAPTPSAASPGGWHERDATPPPAAPARAGGFGRKGL